MFPNYTKKDLNLEGSRAPISVGAFVVFVDGSFALNIENSSYELKHGFLGLNDDIWQVVAINVPCPTDLSHLGSLAYHNNCIVKNEKGDIAFCSQINIQNIKYLGSSLPFTLK